MPKRILVISPTPTHPVNTGNRRRIYALLEAMESLDSDFHFAFFTLEQSDQRAMQERWGERRVSVIPHHLTQRYAAFGRRVRNFTLRHLGVEQFHPLEIDAWASAELGRVIQDLARAYQPTTVLVEYVFNSWILELFPGSIRKLIDTHDVFANRNERFLKVGAKPDWFSTTRRQERKGLLRADCVIAIQDQEADYFRRLTKRQVVTVGHITPVVPLPEPPAGAPTLLFVGADGTINRDALRYCFEAVWPAIKAELPAARFLVVGRICNSFPSVPPGVELRGELPDVLPGYAEAHVVLNPLRFGTGLKIKSIEALSHGRALVTTPIGAEGMEEACDRAFVIGRDAGSLAGHCVRLLREHGERRLLASQGARYVAEWNVRHRQALRQALEDPACPAARNPSGFDNAGNK